MAASSTPTFAERLGDAPVAFYRMLALLKEWGDEKGLKVKITPKAYWELIDSDGHKVVYANPEWDRLEVFARPDGSKRPLPNDVRQALNATVRELGRGQPVGSLTDALESKVVVEQWQLVREKILNKLATAVQE